LSVHQLLGSVQARRVPAAPPGSCVRVTPLACVGIAQSAAEEAQADASWRL
jgi:hypothetical protein